MEPQILLFIGFAALVVGGILWGQYAAAKRRKQLAAWAAAGGLAFSTARDSSYDSRYACFECLRQGSNRYAYNISQGMRGRRGVRAFDYHYETYSTDNKGRRKTHHHHFSAVMLDSELPLRPLQIRPEGLFDKLAGFFGYDDINFELDAFSRAFHVKAPDRQWAYDVIHQATMEFLLAQPRFNLELEQGWVLVWRGRRMGPADFDAAIATAEGILDRLPRYLVQELKGASS